MIRKIIYFVGFTLLLATVVFAANGRKISQMSADQATAWEVFTDVGCSLSVAEANLLNQGTDYVSDTVFHTVYATTPLDFPLPLGNGTRSAGRIAWAKPNDMYAKVIGATICLDSTAIIPGAAKQMFMYIYRYNAPTDTASGTPRDSLITTNKIQLDSTIAVAGGNFKPLTVQNGVISDSGAIEIVITCDTIPTNMPHGSVTFEIYVKPE